MPATPLPTPTLPTDPTLDAALQRCPTAAEIAFVDARLTLTFSVDPTAGNLACHSSAGSADLTPLEEVAYQAVLAMRRIPFDAPLPWTHRSLFNWFTHAVTGADFQSTATVSYCCENDRTVVIRSDRDMGLEKRWISPDGLSGLDGVMVLLVHEARHAEGYLHDCNSSDPHGDQIDDRTIGELGAWGVQYWLEVWLAKHADSAYMAASEGPLDRYQQSAGASAAFILAHRICEPLPA